VKRDDDLLRGLLFEFEAEDDWLLILPQTLNMSQDDRVKIGHVNLLCDAGYVTQVGKGTYRLTNQGYDFLDAIRDETIWKKTKAGAAEVGGMTLGMIKDLALAYVKQEAAEKLGIRL